MDDDEGHRGEAGEGDRVQESSDVTKTSEVAVYEAMRGPNLILEKLRVPLSLPRAQGLLSEEDKNDCGHSSLTPK